MSRDETFAQDWEIAPVRFRWRRWLALTAFLSLALNALLTLWGRGRFLPSIIAIMVAILVGPAALIVSGFLALFRKKWRYALGSAQTCLAIAMIAISAFLSVFTGEMMLRMDLREARAYCDELIPKLDAYKMQHGAYPATAVGLTTSDWLPVLLDRDFFYLSDGDSFEFRYDNPGAMMEGFHYDSVKGTWEQWD